MASRKGSQRTYEDDDGRTIADMSGVGRPSLFGAGIRRPAGAEEPGARGLRDEVPGAGAGARGAEREPLDLTPSEKRWAVLGALKASLAVTMVYVVGIGLVVAVLLLVWGALSG